MILRQLPNLISLLRLLATLPVTLLILAEAYASALVLFVVAGLSDGVDGFLAKRYNWRSVVGGCSTP
ncbi:hypothetical protein CAI21_04980 [Alkalilimnicola ehrlichii]|uniref:CDP-alcohol phosphatidyltransferase n=1 Tax=Alkalilimnicola ehrlichii TaxID=351052 RepID=A0A3E0WYA6_9GAMM|nr:CDP-alcohol phosphatidyltransferase family protein [Alkalilimnicola ehrlichii]RFA30432.1 hypothetical protein CAI21_04980 [Alkalilimnicola ehrlichii]RFA37984.1 hypothetical protein CAL65_06355 [Alkalilimnicola ehrlichii]